MLPGQDAFGQITELGFQLLIGHGHFHAADGVLDVTITQTTLVGCPPDSLEEPFVLALHDATSYSVDGFLLVISGPTGEMHFAPAMPDMA